MKIRPLSPVSLIHNSLYKNSDEKLKDDMQNKNNPIVQFNNNKNKETQKNPYQEIPKKVEANSEILGSSQGYNLRNCQTVQNINTSNIQTINNNHSQNFIDIRIQNSIESINLIASQSNKKALQQWEQYEKIINDSFLEQNQISQLNNISYTINKLNNFALQQIEKSGNITLVQRVINSCLNWLDFFGSFWQQTYIKQSQQPIISLQNSQRNKCEDFIYFSYQQNDQIINKSNFPIILSETILFLKVLTMNNQGTVFRRKGQFQAALEIFNQSLHIIQCSKRKEYLGLTYLNLSILYSSLGNHNLSLENANYALIEQQKLFFEKNYTLYNQNLSKSKENSPSRQQKMFEKKQNNSTPIQQIQPNFKIDRGNISDQNTNNSQQIYKQSKNVDNKTSQNLTYLGKNNNATINFYDLYFYKEEREEEFLQQVNTLAVSYFNIAAEMEYFQRWEEALRYYEYSYICTQKYFGDDNCMTLQFYEEFKLFQSRQAKLKIDNNFNDNRRTPHQYNIPRSFSYHKDRSVTNHKKIKADSFYTQQIQISRSSSKNTVTTKESEKEPNDDSNQQPAILFVTQNYQKMDKLKKFMQSLSPSIKNHHSFKGRHQSLHLNLNINNIKYKNNRNRTPNNNSLQQSLMFYQNSIDQAQQNSNIFQTQAQNKSQINISSQTPSNAILSSTASNAKKNMFSSFLKKSSTSFYNIFTPKGMNNNLQNNQSNIDQQQQTQYIPQFLSSNSSGNFIQYNQNILSPQRNQKFVHSLLNSPKQMIQTQSVKNFTSKNQSHINLNSLQIQKQALNQNINKKVPLLDRIQQFSELNKQRYQFNQIDDLKNDFQFNQSLNQDKIEQFSTTISSKKQDDMQSRQSQNLHHVISHKKHLKISHNKDNKQFQKTLTQSSPSSPIYQDLPFSETINKNKNRYDKQSIKEESDLFNQDQIKMFNIKEQSKISPSNSPYNKLKESNKLHSNQTTNNDEQYCSTNENKQEQEFQQDISKQGERIKSWNKDYKQVKDHSLKRNNTNKLKQVLLQKNNTETKQIIKQSKQKKNNDKQKNDDPYFLKQKTYSEQSFEENGDEENEQEDSFWNNQILNDQNLKNKKQRIQEISTAKLKQKIYQQQGKKFFLRQRQQSLPNLNTEQDEQKNKFNQNQLQINNRDLIHNQLSNKLLNVYSNQQSKTQKKNKQFKQNNQIQFIYRIEKQILYLIPDNIQTNHFKKDQFKTITQQPFKTGSLSFTLVEQTILIASYNLKDKQTEVNQVLLHSFDVSKVKQFVKSNHPINSSQYSSTTNLSKKEDGSDNLLEEYLTDQEIYKGQLDEECKSISQKTVTLHSSKDFFRDILNEFSKQINNYFLVSSNEQLLLLDSTKSNSQQLRIKIKNICTLSVQKLQDDKSMVYIMGDDECIQEEQNIQVNQCISQNKKKVLVHGNNQQDTQQKGLNHINDLQAANQLIQPPSSSTQQTLATPLSSIVLSSPKSVANLIGYGSHQNLQLQPTQSTHQLALEQIDELEELKPIMINKFKKGDKISEQSIPQQTGLKESQTSCIQPIFTKLFKKSKKQIINQPNQYKSLNKNNQIDKKDSLNFANPITKQIQECSPINEMGSPFVSPSDQDPTFTTYLKNISPLNTETIKQNGNQNEQNKSTNLQKINIPNNTDIEIPTSEINTIAQPLYQLEYQELSNQNKLNQNEQQQLKQKLNSQTSFLQKQIQLSKNSLQQEEFSNNDQPKYQEQNIYENMNHQIIFNKNAQRQNEIQDQIQYNNQFNINSNQEFNQTLFQNYHGLNNINIGNYNNLLTQPNENMQSVISQQLGLNGNQNLNNNLMQFQYHQQYGQFPEISEEQVFFNSQAFNPFFNQNPNYLSQLYHQQSLQNQQLKENQLQQQIILQNQLIQQYQEKIQEFQKAQEYFNTQQLQDNRLIVQLDSLQQNQNQQDNIQSLPKQQTYYYTTPNFSKNTYTDQTIFTQKSLNVFTHPNFDLFQDKQPQSQIIEIKPPIYFNSQISDIQINQNDQIISAPDSMINYFPSLAQLNIQNPMEMGNSAKIENTKTSQIKHVSLMDLNRSDNQNPQISNNNNLQVKKEIRRSSNPSTIGKKPELFLNNNEQRRYSQFYQEKQAQLAQIEESQQSNQGPQTGLNLNSQNDVQKHLSQQKENNEQIKQSEEQTDHADKNTGIRKIESNVDLQENQQDQNLSISGIGNILNNQDFKNINIDLNSNSNIHKQNSNENYNKISLNFENDKIIRVESCNKINFVNEDNSILIQKKDFDISQDQLKIKKKRSEMESFRSDDISQYNWNDYNNDMSKQIVRYKSNETNIQNYFSANQNISQINKPNDYSPINFNSVYYDLDGENKDEENNNHKNILQSTSQINFTKRDNTSSQISIQLNDNNIHLNDINQPSDLNVKLDGQSSHTSVGQTIQKKESKSNNKEIKESTKQNIQSTNNIKPQKKKQSVPLIIISKVTSLEDESEKDNFSDQEYYDEDNQSDEYCDDENYDHYSDDDKINQNENLNKESIKLTQQSKTQSEQISSIPSGNSEDMKDNQSDPKFMDKKSTKELNSHEKKEQKRLQFNNKQTLSCEEDGNVKNFPLFCSVKNGRSDTYSKTQEQIRSKKQIDLKIKLEKMNGNGLLNKSEKDQPPIRNKSESLMIRNEDYASMTPKIKENRRNSLLSNIANFQNQLQMIEQNVIERKRPSQTFTSLQETEKLKKRRESGKTITPDQNLGSNQSHTNLQTKMASIEEYQTDSEGEKAPKEKRSSIIYNKPKKITFEHNIRLHALQQNQMSEHHDQLSPYFKLNGIFANGLSQSQTHSSYLHSSNESVQTRLKTFTFDQKQTDSIKNNLSKICNKDLLSQEQYIIPPEQINILKQ